MTLHDGAEAVLAHWTSVARRGEGETPCKSIKRLEVAALRRVIERLNLPMYASILEAGCGSGQNVVALAESFIECEWMWTGFDYVPEMVAAARKNAADHGLLDRANFVDGDIRSIRDLRGFNVVFTDRLLINLSSIGEQVAAIEALKCRLIDGGSLILIENSRQTKDAQNNLREVMGLERRKDATFNLFLDDDVIIRRLQSLFSTVEVEDFGSLHDILLYVLLPAMVGEEFQYEHPMMGRVADLCERVQMPMGAFGQNRMYVCRGPR